MNTEPIKQKIDEVRAAHETLKWLIDAEGYNNYLRGLLDAYEAVVDARVQAANQPNNTKAV